MGSDTALHVYCNYGRQLHIMVVSCGCEEFFALSNQWVEPVWESYVHLNLTHTAGMEIILHIHSR